MGGKFIVEFTVIWEVEGCDFDDGLEGTCWGGLIVDDL